MKPVIKQSCAALGVAHEPQAYLTCAYLWTTSIASVPYVRARKIFGMIEDRVGQGRSRSGKGRAANFNSSWKTHPKVSCNSVFELGALRALLGQTLRDTLILSLAVITRRRCVPDYYSVALCAWLSGFNVPTERSNVFYYVLLVLFALTCTSS